MQLYRFFILSSENCLEIEVDFQVIYTFMKNIAQYLRSTRKFTSNSKQFPEVNMKNLHNYILLLCDFMRSKVCA